jgi:hypothetical protein
MVAVVAIEKELKEKKKKKEKKKNTTHLHSQEELLGFSLLKHLVH